MVDGHSAELVDAGRSIPVDAGRLGNKVQSSKVVLEGTGEEGTEKEVAVPIVVVLVLGHRITS